MGESGVQSAKPIEKDTLLCLFAPLDEDQTARTTEPSDVALWVNYRGQKIPISKGVSDACVSIYGTRLLRTSGGNFNCECRLFKDGNERYAIMVVATAGIAQGVPVILKKP